MFLWGSFDGEAFHGHDTKVYNSFKLKRDCPIDLLDDKHILLWVMVEEDFTRLCVRHALYVMNKPMTISKWTIDFCPNQESSLAPV